ncbi:hypothetical protein F511_32323 [Dorcoceras hygrometricum]|uniref:Uncharacterized protein n=1 Tax=Dorcoceras hygrometricum TaxID=472368 RepID=A0A2Z7D0L2_9LAMI|nr:hypothetical protein F511_32323 [Dorcoceras hygrometricum]
MPPPPAAKPLFRPFWREDSIRDNSMCFLVQGSEGFGNRSWTGLGVQSEIQPLNCYCRVIYIGK